VEGGECPTSCKKERGLSGWEGEMCYTRGDKCLQDHAVFTTETLVLQGNAPGERFKPDWVGKKRRKITDFLLIYRYIRSDRK